MSFFSNLFKKKAKVGDNVRCIDDVDWNSDSDSIILSYGGIYKITDIQIFKGIIIYDIGCRCPGTYTYLNGEKIPGRDIHWAHSKRFVLTDDNCSESSNKEELEKNLEKAIIREDYLEAKKIKEEIDTL